MTEVSDAKIHIVEQYHNMAAKLRVCGEATPHFLIINSLEWCDIITNCIKYRIIELYDDMCDLSELIFTHLDLIEPLTLCKLSKIHFHFGNYDEFGNPRMGSSEMAIKFKNMTLSEIVEYVNHIEISEDYLMPYCPSINILNVIEAHAAYFRRLWFENQKLLDGKRPAEIMENLNYPTNSLVFSAMMTLYTGEWHVDKWGR